jgi:drug/metabolite transporter (DMT)-like permease
VPYLRLLGAQLAIGAAAIFARYALTGAGPFAVSALRLAIAAIPFVILALLARSPVRLGWRRELVFAGAGIALAAHFATWIGSLLYTSVAVSTILVATTPIWTCAYAAIVERRPPARAYYLALGLAALGLVAIVLQRVAPAPVPGQALLGDALALAGGMAIGVYLILVQRFGFAPADGRPIPTRDIVARTYSWAALALVPLMLFAHQGPPAIGDYRAWFGVLGMAIFAQLIGHTALNAALRDFTPSVVAMATLLEPVSAALLAALLFAEAISPATALGGLAILTAVAITLRVAELKRVPGAQHFGDAPGLCDAAARGERGVAVGDFTERSEPAADDAIE